ncbi:MAG: hypothetical protein IPO50_12845 [Sphingomonadales bacterium]|nr:hypothetical protein [Sphingomonadales bacterium]
MSLVNWAGIDAVRTGRRHHGGVPDDVGAGACAQGDARHGVGRFQHGLDARPARGSRGPDAAALERTTGNYAFGDVSHGNLNANNRQMAQWNQAPPHGPGRPFRFFGAMMAGCTHQYGEGHTVIDSSGVVSQLPFKASMTRGYAMAISGFGASGTPWNRAERIENGTSATWSSSRGHSAVRSLPAARSADRAAARVAFVRHALSRRHCLEVEGLVGQGPRAKSRMTI